MNHSTTIKSLPAIVGGSISAAIAWATLTKGAPELSLEHVQAAALVGLTILAGHLAGQAWQERRSLHGIGLTALAVVGSLLTVYNAMGSRAEVRDTKVAAASLTEAMRSGIEADLRTTTTLVEQATKWQATSCGKDRTSDTCKGHTFLLRQREASRKALQAQLVETGPVVAPEPKAGQVALLASFAGYDRAFVKAVVSAVEPLAFPLFLEVLAIVLFGFGLGHKQTAVASIADSRQTSFWHEEIDCPTPPDGGSRQSNVVPFTKHPAIEAIEKAGGSVSNRTLARLMQCSEGEASKRWQEVRDQLDIGRQGKELRISLKRTA